MSAGTTVESPSRRGAATATRPLLASIAVLCASSALSGVLSGAGWVPYTVGAVLLVAVIGFLLRSLHTPRVLVPVGQVIGLGCLTVVLFSGNGILAFLPGPAALHDLGSLLGRAGEAIRSGIAPMPADTPVSCLLVLALGAVAVAVDFLVTEVAAPAIAGLPLLCVYAVPTALDDDMLPWWSFALGIGGFALLLAAEHAGRTRTRNTGSTGSPGRGFRRPSLAAGGGTPVAALALGGVGLLLALLTGGQTTLIGTAGRLPGGGAGNGAGAMSGQLGVEPFTSVRGMLNDTQRSDTLFRVKGLGDHDPYLRALTLDEFRPNQGWVLRQPLPAGVRTFGTLPAEPGSRRQGPTTSVRIEPVHWNDLWLPVYGVPRRLSGTGSRWHYDDDTGIVYSTSPARPGRYTERAMLAQPTAQQLRGASTDYSSLDQRYLHVPRVAPDVSRLARTITAGTHSTFDKASALYRYFTDPTNGYTYSTHTAPATSGSALRDFLLRGKTGYCEQYASAMAVMLRELGIPSRVAIGFTGGTHHDGYRTISSLDAHAWDEVYFPGFGWQPFDPTPLGDGRSSVPSYLAASAGADSGPDALRPGQQPEQSTEPAGPGHHRSAGTPAGAAPVSPVPARSASGWLGTVLWSLLGLTVALTVLTLLSRRYPPGRGPRQGVRGRLRRLALPATAACWLVTLLVATAWVTWWLPLLLATMAVLGGPMLLRLLRRRHRRREASRLGPRAAYHAWQEVLAESADRGGSVERHDTLRVTAGKLARRHHLDPDGEHRLRSLVDAVERATYSRRPPHDVDLAGLVREIRLSFRRTAPLRLRSRLFPRSVLRRN